jgi:5-methylcytosine-specific restriction endonuclease McrA
MQILGFFKQIRYAVRSPKWSSVRKDHLQNHPACAACGRQKKLEVHHKIPVHLNPDLELDPNNLITLCDDPCHLIFGHLLNYKSYNKSVEEDCAVYLNKVTNRP